MKYPGFFYHVSDERAPIIMPHPAYFVIVPEIENSLNNIAAMAFWIDGLWRNIPKERLTETNNAFFM